MPKVIKTVFLLGVGLIFFHACFPHSSNTAGETRLVEILGPRGNGEGYGGRIVIPSFAFATARKAGVVVIYSAQREKICEIAIGNTSVGAKQFTFLSSDGNGNPRFSLPSREAGVAPPVFTVFPDKSCRQTGTLVAPESLTLNETIVGNVGSWNAAPLRGDLFLAVNPEAINVMSADTPDNFLVPIAMTSLADPPAGGNTGEYLLGRLPGYQKVLGKIEDGSLKIIDATNGVEIANRPMPQSPGRGPFAAHFVGDKIVILNQRAVEKLSWLNDQWVSEQGNIPTARQIQAASFAKDPDTGDYRLVVATATPPEACYVNPIT